MTKVKTILAEFCTAKDILAINRLGLLKKDERESQPIPWRHRLPNKERRELVRSELRMSSRPPSNNSKKEVTRALNNARTVKDSKLGECLLYNQLKSGSELETSLRGISGEERRSQSQLRQLRTSFLRRSACLNHEPLILVERPASPKVKSRAAFKDRHGVDPIVATVPRYMRPLTSRTRTPSTLTTIEAFTVETKKKKNIWEEVVEDREERKFKSTSKPSARLTEYEKKQLKIGHMLHKPTQESIASLADLNNDDDSDENDDVTTSRAVTPAFESALFSRPKSDVPRKKSGGKSRTADEPEPFKRPETIAEGSVFVTQMSQKELEGSGSKGRLKSVTFSDVSRSTDVRKSGKDNRKLLLLQGNGEVKRRMGRQEAQGLYAVSAGSSSSAKKKSSPKAMTSMTSRPTLADKEKKAESFFSVILNH